MIKWECWKDFRQERSFDTDQMKPLCKEEMIASSGCCGTLLEFGSFLNYMLYEASEPKYNIKKIFQSPDNVEIEMLT